MKIIKTTSYKKAQQYIAMSQSMGNLRPDGMLILGMDQKMSPNLQRRIRGLATDKELNYGDWWRVLLDNEKKEINMLIEKEAYPHLYKNKQN